MILKGWIGPEDKIIDFTYGELDVEIKSSSYSGEDKITINRYKQLQYIRIDQDSYSILVLLLILMVNYLFQI